MKYDVRQYVKTCHMCQVTKPTDIRDRAPLEEIDRMDSLPFSSLVMDVMGGELPISKRGNKYVLVLQCQATIWVHCIALRNLRADTVATKLIQFVAIFGIPRQITSDNYSGFVSELLTKVKDKLGIETKLSAPWHFQSHGDVERANRTIESMIHKFIEDSPRDWDENLHLLCFA